MSADANKMFTETPLVRRKHREEAIAKWIFCAMAAAMIVPLLLILGYLIERAWPSLSIGFILTFPPAG
jgi:phosphate transport system permease protein